MDTKHQKNGFLKNENESQKEPSMVIIYQHKNGCTCFCKFYLGRTDTQQHFFPNSKKCGPRVMTPSALILTRNGRVNFHKTCLEWPF